MKITPVNKVNFPNGGDTYVEAVILLNCRTDVYV